MKIKRRRSGDYSVELHDWQKQILNALIPQLRDLLVDGSDPALRRLYPTAYPHDAEADEAYGTLVHDQLLESRLAALDLLESQIDETQLPEADLDQWLRSINSIRLVLGTRLDVSEDDDPTRLAEDDPDRDLWIVYQVLSEMLALIIEAVEHRR